MVPPLTVKAQGWWVLELPVLLPPGSCSRAALPAALPALAPHFAAVCRPLQTLCKPSAGARAGPSRVSGAASMPRAGVCFLPTATEPEQWLPVPGRDG